eukprot:m.169645 g.169645  ORF g.169645 m.169645 type:complete len:128 (-) comp15271_c0_seq44:1060-1443(-)
MIKTGTPRPTCKPRIAATASDRPRYKFKSLFSSRPLCPSHNQPVLVLRLVTANTIEERIMQRAEGKRRLEKLVIHKGKFKGRQQEDAPLSPADLLELIGGDTRAVPISEVKASRSPRPCWTLPLTAA